MYDPDITAVFDMSIRPANLPDYERPPIAEVVIGAQFNDLRLGQGHVGLLWSSIRDRYPEYREAPPLQNIIEVFDRPADGEMFEMGNMPPLRRSWFLGREPQWLLQVQEDRIIHNWRRVADSDVYPKFEACLERFMGAWSALSALCTREKLSAPDYSQLEVTYINHIPQSAGWSSLAEIGNVIPDLQWRSSSRILPVPENAAWQASFRLPFEQARLHATVKHARRTRDGKPVLLCEFTVRGMPAEKMSMQEWLLEARTWCVQAFADVTSKDVQQKVWGLK